MNSARMNEFPNVPEPILGWEIFELHKPLYSEEEMHQVLVYHRFVAQKFGIEDAYFRQDPTATPEDSILVNQDFRDYSIQGGRLSDFSILELAAAIHEQIRAYVEEDTMSHEFPKNDAEAVQALIASMISGFDPNTLLTIGKGKGDAAQFHPYSIVIVRIGQTKDLLANSIGSPTNLSTLSSLYIEQNLLPENLASAPLFTVACIGRLATQFDLDDRLRVTLIPRTLAVMGKVMDELNNNKVPPIEGLIFDTHLPSLEGMAKKRFGGQVVASGDLVQPTEAALQSGVKHHYEYYQGKISWMYTPVEAFIQGGRRFLND